MTCLSLTLYRDFGLLPPHVRSGLETVGALGGSAECGGGGRWIYCKCTHCMLCLIIMCNVAALTFYATIYENICCICNKSREKHVLGTASTAGSLCSFDRRVLTTAPGPEVTTYNHHVLIKTNLTLFFVLYASVVLVHQSCSSFIVLNKEMVLLWLRFTCVRPSMTMLKDCLHE